MRNYLIPFYLILLLLGACKKSSTEFSDLKMLAEHKEWEIESAEFRMVKTPANDDVKSEEYGNPKPEDYHYDVLTGGRVTYTDTAFELTFVKNSITTKRNTVDRISIYLNLDNSKTYTHPLIKKEYHLTNHKDQYGVEYTYPMEKKPTGYFYTPVTNWNGKEITVHPKAYVKKIKGSKKIHLYIPCAETPYNLDNMGEIKLTLNPKN